MDNIDVKVKDLLLKLVAHVFDAVVNPAVMAQFFISSSSGPMAQGETANWYFNHVGGKLPVLVKTVIDNELMVFDWAASGIAAQVSIAFTAVDGSTTSVTITEKSFPFDKTGVAKALQQTQGWTDFLCSMKAYLYCGINLRTGRTKVSY